MKNKNQIGILKRAALFIARKKTKSVILLIIVFVLITLVAAGISIGNATEKAAENLRETLGGYFKLQTNWESPEPGLVTDGLVDEIMRDGQIRAYNKMNILYLMANDLTPIPGRFASENDLREKLLRLLSNTDSSLHEYFYTRALALREGRHITRKDRGKALISSALAQTNDLKIGDTISVTLSEEYAPPDSDAIGNRYSLEIVGIYEISFPQKTDDNTAECDIMENYIFIDESTVKQIDMDVSGTEREAYGNGAAFFLNDPQGMGAVVESVKQKNGISEGSFRITVNNKAYNDSMLPLIKLGSYTNILIVIIIIIGTLLLSLVMTMWMRDRLHEIGILLAIGIKKVSILGQHMLEALIVMAVALIIAWPVSGAIANALGSYLLNIVPVEEQTQQVNSRISAYENDPVDVSEAIRAEALDLDIQIGALEMLSLAGCSILIIAASVGVSSITVFKMKPKDILSSME